MNQEYITKLLQSNKCIENVKLPNNEGADFDRFHEFFVRGIKYKIEWWTNQCYLHINEVIIPFSSMEISGSWPNRFKYNIQFLGRHKTRAFDVVDKVCIIPLEEFLAEKSQEDR